MVTEVKRPGADLPGRFTLGQNYPNPSNPRTTITFEIGASSTVSLKVYDLLGREIATLVDGEMLPGTYAREFDGGNLASGVYYYRLNATGAIGQRAGLNSTLTRKFILLR